MNDIKATPIGPDAVQSMDLSFYSGLYGIALEYTNGAICESTNLPRTFTVNVYCMNGVEGDFLPEAYGTDCNRFVNVVSQFGCPLFDFNDVFYYIAKYKYYWGGPLILIGLLMNLFGRKMIKVSVCFAGFLTCVIAACGIFYFTQVDEVEDLQNLDEFWYFLGGGALLGIPIGLLLAKLDRAGVAVLAGWGGYTAGLILYETCFAYT